MKINKLFGKFILEKRKERNLTQDGLAGAVDITRSTLAKIENGDSSPSLDKVQKLLTFFELQFKDLDSLLESEGLEAKVNESIKSAKDRDKILKHFKEL